MKHQPPHQLTSQKTLSQRAAEGVAVQLGSWHFLTIQSLVIVTWVFFNLLGMAFHWDPYPFILLNLLFSTQAAYAAPIILMAQNRQAEVDRLHAKNAYAHIDEALSGIQTVNAKQDRQLDELLRQTTLLLELAKERPS